MNRREREELARRLAAMDAEVASNVERFRAEHKPGRAAFRTEVLSVVEALNHPLVGAAMHDASAAAYGFAHEVGPGELMSECFTCRTAWARRAPPAAALLVIHVGTPMGA